MKELDEYQNFAWETAIYPTDMSIIYPALGLAGETGEVADKIKKVYRDNGGLFGGEHKKAIAKELGDVLWYVANIATDLGYGLSEIAQMNVEKINSRRERDKIHGDGDDR